MDQTRPLVQYARAATAAPAAAAEGSSRPARAAAGSAVARITQAIKQEDPPDRQSAARPSQPRRRPSSKAAKATLPHQLAASRPADFDFDVLRKRALLGLQIRAGLDASPSDRAVYETDKWDPCKPFVTDKILKLPCMNGRQVVYCSGTTIMQPRKDTPCAEGHIADDLNIKCHGCSFVGSRSRFEKHLGSGAKKANQHIFLREEQISLKELGVLCSAVDLNLTHCIYCKRDQTADNADAGGGVTVKQELQLKPDPDAAPAAAAAAAAGASNPPAAGGVRFNTVVTCSTCPAVFHASCYEVNTGEQVGIEDDWQCVSCRQGARCAAGGCAWCKRHSPHLRRFTMTSQFEGLRQEFEPQQAEVRQGNARVDRTAAAAAAAAAAGGAAGQVRVKQEEGAGSVAQPSSVAEATTAAAAAAGRGTAPSDADMQDAHGSVPTPGSGEGRARKKRRTASASPPPPAAAAAAGGKPDRIGPAAAVAEPAHTGTGRRRHGRQQQEQQQQQQNEEQPRMPGTPGVRQQQATRLQLTRLGEGEWLPAWVNQYQAEEALYSMCMAAEAPDSLVQQLQAVMNRLQGLAPLDLPVCRFRAHYARLLLWGRRRNIGEFEAALRRLASM